MMSRDGRDEAKEDDPLSRLHLGSFLQWMLCFCIVDFDLEKGQALESIFPPVELSPDDIKTISFSAFPDSNSQQHHGDSLFSFRMRNGTQTSSLYAKQSLPAFASLSSDPGLPILTDGFTYGYVFFRQKRDAQVRRGFFQKSLVLLSPYPWSGLFMFLLNILGPQIMDSLGSDRRLDGVQNAALLETAAFNIASWPSPPSLLSPEVHYSSCTLSLPFLGLVQCVSFPPNSRFPQLFVNPQPRVQKTILCNPCRLYQIFSRSIEHVWMTWELMMMGEPILVIADTPHAASETVLALVELIKPVPFGGDFRPYFTIQDVDFGSLASPSRTPRQGTVLGVTNMVFEKLLDNWPNVIKVSRSIQLLGGNDILRSQSPPFANSPLKQAFQEDYYHLQIDKLTSKHKPNFSKDKKLIKDLLEGGVNGMAVDSFNNLIRRHFTELTERFLQPLNRYFETLVVGNPSLMTLSTLRNRPNIRPFQQDSFLLRIEQNNPTLPLTSKRPLVDFYRLFLKSPNFAQWLQSRTADVFRGWRQKYLDTLSNADVTDWISQRVGTAAEIECIDLMLRLKGELEKYSKYFVIEDGVVKYADVPGIPPNDSEDGWSRPPSGRSSPTKSIGTSSPPSGSRRGMTGSQSGQSLNLLEIPRSPSPMPFSNSRPPTPTMDGFVPTALHFSKMREQLESIMNALPAELKSVAPLE